MMIFNPSLIISLGISSNKALLYTKKLLSNAPAAFLDLIDFYEVNDIDAISKDVQEVIDTKLLSAKALNKLVDMGYKIRNEMVSYVRVNIYIFWEANESTASVLEVVKLLSELNYGNIDKSQHSGVSLFVIPIFDKEWTIKENYNTEAFEELIKLKNYLSLTENMLRLDSKIFLLHSITNDGTRIPKEELIYISAIMVYLNTIPSGEPPLSSYIKRVLMHEGNYKVGTIGISSLMMFKDSLKEEFSRYLAENILKYALEYEDIEGLKHYDSIDKINLHNDTKLIMDELSFVADDGKLKLSNDNMDEVNLNKDILEYPKLLKNWKDKLELNYVTVLKERIKNEAIKHKNNIIENIENELKEVSEKFSLKEGLNYLNSILSCIDKNILKSKVAKDDNLITLDKKLKKQVESCTNLTYYIIKGVLLLAVLSIILIAFVIPNLSGALRIATILTFVLIGFALYFLDYLFNIKKLKSIIYEYKEEVLRVEGRLLNNYAKDTILEEYTKLKTYILDKKKELLSIMEALEIIKNNLRPLALKEEAVLGNLVVELLTSEERLKFYADNFQGFNELYTAFVCKLGSYKVMGEESLKDKLLEFSSSAKQQQDLDFYEYFRFKYKEQSGAELSKWISKGLVKARYLLQYIKTNLEEEHLFFIASPEVFKLLNQTEANNLSSLKYSCIASEHINTNCVAIVRISLGIEFDNIISFRKKVKE